MKSLLRALRPLASGRTLVATDRPWALAHLEGRLMAADGPVLLVTADLRRPEIPSRPEVEWRSLESLAAETPAVAHACRAVRTWLPTEVALKTLEEPLSALTRALGPHRRNVDNWTWTRKRTGLDATLQAFNAATWEGLRLKLTAEGAERWPALAPDNPESGRYVCAWIFRPEQVPEVVTALREGSSPPGGSGP